MVTPDKSGTHVLQPCEVFRDAKSGTAITGQFAEEQDPQGVGLGE
jgi:hypothetical protein